MPSIASTRASSSEKRIRSSFGEVAAVAVDVLAQQRHLAHAVGGEALDLGDELAGRARDLAAARRGHDAVGADAVAALRDLDPGLELALALERQVAGDVLELEVALGAERVRVQELGELVDLAGAEGDVDEREAREDLVLDRLGPAPPDSDDALGVLALEPLGLAEVGDEAVVGRLADRAGVEEDQVGVARARRTPRSRASRASPSCARSRARSSGNRTWSRGSGAPSPRMLGAARIASGALPTRPGDERWPSTTPSATSATGTSPC